MTREHWFLPDTPDVLGQLQSQAALAQEGLDSFARWAAGDAAAEAGVADAKQRADAAKRELLSALRSALITPLEPEDVFALSRGLDHILTAARDVGTEARVLAVEPDDGVAEMARLLAEGVRHLGEAIAQLGNGGDTATAAADAAIDSTHEVEAAYGRGMAALLDLHGRSARIGGRELYRRCWQIAGLIVDVAERVVYAIVKQS